MPVEPGRAAVPGAGQAPGLPEAVEGNGRQEVSSALSTKPGRSAAQAREHAMPDAGTRAFYLPDRISHAYLIHADSPLKSTARRPAACARARLNWPRGVVVALTCARDLPAAVPDLLPELPDRAVLHARQDARAGCLPLHLRRLRLLAGASRNRPDRWPAAWPLIAVPLGGMLAFLMVRTDLPGRGWIAPLLLVPIFVSPMVLAFGYVVADGPGRLLFGLGQGSCSACVPWNIYSLPGIVDHRRPDARAARLPVRVVGAEEPGLGRRGGGARGRRLAVAGGARTCRCR